MLHNEQGLAQWGYFMMSGPHRSQIYFNIEGKNYCLALFVTPGLQLTDIPVADAAPYQPPLAQSPMFYAGLSVNSCLPSLKGYETKYLALNFLFSLPALQIKSPQKLFSKKKKYLTEGENYCQRKCHVLNQTECSSQWLPSQTTLLQTSTSIL
jgi:hypothetical protein